MEKSHAYQEAVERNHMSTGTPTGWSITCRYKGWVHPVAEPLLWRWGRVRPKQTIIRVTHEFVDDPDGVRRAYDTWAMLLARSLNLDAPDQAKTPGTSRRSARRDA